MNVTPANEQERAQLGWLADAVQAVSGATVELAFVDQGYTGPEPAPVAVTRGIQIELVKLAKASCCCPGAGWSSVALPG